MSSPKIIVEAKISFVDTPTEFKYRPCVLMSSPRTKNDLVVVLPITSSINNLDESDVVLDICESHTGLTKNSIIKTCKITTIEARSIRYIIGKLSTEKTQEIFEKLDLLLER
jgi:mRNA-degrading endonuclease toxin of MazEF toxin-antitoxin module